MTQNGAFKKRVRARAAALGESYTTALRRLQAERDGIGCVAPVCLLEPRYQFVPPGSIEFIDDRGRRALEPESGPAFSWGSGGDSQMTSADAVLVDATGSTDPHLALAFVAENLSFWTELAGKPFVLTVAEVRAWRRENEFRIRDEARRQRVLNPAAAAQLIFELLNGPPRRPWWESHRLRHGAPPILSSVGSSSR